MTYPIVAAGPTQRVIAEVVRERERQDEKWGEQNHDLTVWMTVLGEEFGEACADVLHSRESPERLATHLANARTELIQCAAVAVAAVEYIDRHGLAEQRHA